MDKSTYTLSIIKVKFKTLQYSKIILHVNIQLKATMCRFFSHTISWMVVSQQLLDGSPWNLVQMFILPTGCCNSDLSSGDMIGSKFDAKLTTFPSAWVLCIGFEKYGRSLCDVTHWFLKSSYEVQSGRLRPSPSWKCLTPPNSWLIQNGQRGGAEVGQMKPGCSNKPPSG